LPGIETTAAPDVVDLAPADSAFYIREEAFSFMICTRVAEKWDAAKLLIFTEEIV
jgi:hypothetical protein